MDFSQKILEGQAGALSNILDGAIDIDKLDYLRRDSYHCGLPYGSSNKLDTLASCYRINVNDLAITEEGVPAVEGFLLLQDQMLTDVYWHQKSRAAFAAMYAILILILWTGEKGQLDKRKFELICSKLKNERNEHSAIQNVLIPEMESSFPGVWKDRKYDGRNLKERGLELLKSLEYPHEQQSYKCIAEYKFSDEIPDVKTARASIWQTIYQSPDLSNSMQAINWDYVTGLRHSFKDAKRRT